MKKNIKIILITLIVVISLNSIACRKGEFADEYTNVKWYSYDPVLEFSYGEDDHTRVGLALAYSVCERNGLALEYEFKEKKHIFSVILKK